MRSIALLGRQNGIEPRRFRRVYLSRRARFIALHEGGTVVMSLECTNRLEIVDGAAGTISAPRWTHPAKVPTVHFIDARPSDLGREFQLAASVNRRSGGRNLLAHRQHQQYLETGHWAREVGGAWMTAMWPRP